VVTSVSTNAGTVPQVSAELTSADSWGTVKVRWGVRRINYKVDPGLYALGCPDDKSLVLVSANYKLSFDTLRSALKGRDLWILVLDTNGVNVWCAAAKGTFSTTELVRRLEFSRLEEVVSHRSLILPQLAAPGVAAHEVKKLSGFKVTYGPIRSADLPAFIDGGFKATPEMRLKTFSIWERLVLVPVELVAALKMAVIIVPIFALIGGLGGSSGYWADLMNHGLFAAAALLSGVLAGTVLAPILLPWLPGRAFALKGTILGLLVALNLIFFWNGDSMQRFITLENLAWFLLVSALSAYFTMNFTGASTYTSLSGVKKEMRWAVPMQIAAATLGLVLWSWSLFIE
jgi:acetyl-CoA decarbonylase/synthase complex subunit gamma